MPALKFSQKMSKCGASDFTSSRPSGCFRSMPTLCLPSAVAQERRAGAPAVEVGHERRRATARLAVARVLDLHHLGAEPAEQHRGVRQRLHLLHREDAHAVERLAVVLRAGVGDVTDLHDLTLML